MTVQIVLQVQKHDLSQEAFRKQMTEFDRLLPPLATLVPFEAAFRHRNFTRAGQELHMSQASVSRRIRELESDLGVSLFERGRYDVTPTAEAELLAASVRLSLAELSSTADRLRVRASGESSLTILSDPSLASVVVAPAVGEMQRQNPGLSVRLLSSCEPIEATHERFDIAVQYGPSALSQYAVEFVGNEAVFPVCSLALAEGLPSRISAEQLTELPLLHVDYDDPTWPTWQTVLGAEAIEEPLDRGLVFSSYQVSLDVAEQGGGIALGWERSATPRLEAGTLVRIPGFTVADAGVIHAYMPNHTAPNPHVPELLKKLRERASPKS